MKIRKLCKVGNSLMVSLPKDFLTAIGAQVGDYLRIFLMGEDIVVDRASVDSYQTKGRKGRGEIRKE